MSIEPTKEQIIRYEDLFFKKSRGAYIHNELQGLYDGVNDSTNSKINSIKDKIRQTELYKFGLEMFIYNHHVADSMKWHMGKLKSELAPEVAEAVKRFPTGVSYGVSLREEINRLEKENSELRIGMHRYYGLSEQLKIDKKYLEAELNNKQDASVEPILIHDVDLFDKPHYGISNKDGVFLYCKDEKLAKSLALFFSGSKIDSIQDELSYMNKYKES